MPVFGGFLIKIMEYVDVINEARFLEKNYGIKFSDALKIVFESEKNESLREIRDSIDSLTGQFDEGGTIQKEFDTINLFLEKICKSL
ncbi:MAG: hypothetical protein RLZZ94_699 [Bacteroidota bacterium]|jgi:type II secretory pathway component PulF